MQRIICVLLMLVSVVSIKAITPITLQTELDQILQNNTFVVLGVFQENYGLSKFVENIGKQAETAVESVFEVPVKFVSIDFHKNSDITERYNITAVATCLFFKNSVVVGRTGAVAIACPKNNPKKLLAKMRKAFEISDDAKNQASEEHEREEAAATQVAQSLTQRRNASSSSDRRD